MLPVFFVFRGFIAGKTNQGNHNYNKNGNCDFDKIFLCAF